MIIGNLSGGYLAKNNPKVPFILAVACNLIFGGLVSMFLRETHVPGPNRRCPRQKRRYWDQVRRLSFLEFLAPPPCCKTLVFYAILFCVISLNTG